MDVPECGKHGEDPYACDIPDDIIDESLDEWRFRLDFVKLKFEVVESALRQQWKTKGTNVVMSKLENVSFRALKSDFGDVRIQLQNVEEEVVNVALNFDRQPDDILLLDTLNPSGVIVTTQKEISEILVEHFENKFKKKEVVFAADLFDIVPRVINDEDNKLLDVVPTSEEIKSAVFKMDPDSAHGPDRMGVMINKVVSPQQGAFIKGRNIQNQIVLASELNNEMETTKRGGNSTKISVMVSGGPAGYFSIGRVLKQGDPLSPILFVLLKMY
ncbi:uncharacterized protein LOC113323994 [Papaver somniferum]|uniref:uncharacterized protein LOC113323994 n=1 Tax=Papaver somniferum TaxID=3469 RepID=UPI000E701220|nr:uncharacterized protein LOC113323994 [Papaver somniferum]